MKTKRNYKDSVFRHLFNNEEKLLELFNALMGTAYPEGTSVKIITLENPIFVNVRNDLSAVVAEHYLFMAEHQSTVCLNIPLRMHIYIGEHFKELYKKKNLFAEGAEAVPKVRLFVLYNGRKEQPLEKTYKLSSAYSEKDDIIDLEICVHVININWEMGSQVLQKVKHLETTADLFI